MESKQEQEIKNIEILNSTSRIYPVTEGKSKKTAAVYKRLFERFLEHIKIHDLQVLLDFSPKVIKQMIIDYILYLRDDRQIKRGSIKLHLAAILYFFRINNDDFNLKADNFKLHLPPDESTEDDRPYAVEEIAQILQSCDRRSRMMILLLCSSGMRIGALHTLQIGDLQKLNNLNLYKIQVYARTHDKYYTFCSVECASAIDSYLYDYRQECGEKLVDKSPLIREQFNVDNPFTINAPRFLSEKGIEYIIYQVLKKSGVRKPREVHFSHGFRKFFENQCESMPTMKSVYVDELMGHDTGVKKHYLRTKESVLLDAYMLAVDALTIDPTQRLQRENQELKDDLKGFEHLRDEIDELKHWVLQTNDPKSILQRLNGQVVDHLCSGESTSSIK